MAVKGFYFSFDALLGLMIMALASTVLVISANANTVTSDDIRFSQYSAQANDIANTIQMESAGKIESSELTLSSSEKGLTVSQLLVSRYEENNSPDQVAEAYLEDYRYSTEIYIEDGDLQEVYSDSGISNSASATFLAGSNPYRVIVVVGE